MKIQQRNLQSVLIYSILELNEHYPNDKDYNLEIRMYSDKKSFKAIIRNEHSKDSFGSFNCTEGGFRIDDDSTYTSMMYYLRPDKGLLTDKNLQWIIDELKKPIVVKDNTNTKATFDNNLRAIIEYILLQPIEDRKILERDVVDAINELHYTNNY